MDVFWVVAPCSLVEVYKRFRGPCCLHHQGDQKCYFLNRSLVTIRLLQCDKVTSETQLVQRKWITMEKKNNMLETSYNFMHVIILHVIII
jgi:hypothetical protein